MKKYFIWGIRLLFFGLFIFLTVKGEMMLWLGLFALSLLAILLFGRIYCSYVCPMNTIMIPVNALSKRLKLKKQGTPKWLKSGTIAWAALLLSVAVILLSKRILHINIPILLIWLIFSAVITFFYAPAVFHNLICPFGVLQKLFARFALFHKKVDSSLCIGCGLCEGSCPTAAINVNPENNKAQIDKASCLQCRSCLEACPKKAIQYFVHDKTV